MSRFGVVLVVLLVLMAGCSGLSGGDGSPDREPYGVSEQVNASIDEGPEELLPGLTTERLVDSEELRETHEDVIGDQSYTLEIETEHVIESENESFRVTSETVLYVDPEAEVVHGVVHQRFEGNISIVSPHADAEQNRTVERWFGEETAFMTEFENGTVEYTPPRDGMRRGHDRIGQVSTSLLGPLQSVEETRTAGAVESEEGTYYVLEGAETVPPDDLGPNRDELQFEVRTLVHEDGLVRQTVTEQNSVGADGQRTTINQTTEITAIGETEVERPDWYEEAVAAGSGEPEPENLPDEESERVGNESGGDEAPAGDAEETDDTEDTEDTEGE